MKNFLLILALFFVTTAQASAYTFSRTPSGNGTYESMELSFDTSDITEVCGPIGVLATQIGQYSIGLFDTETVAGSLVPNFQTSYYDVSVLSINETVNFTSSSDIYSIWVTCKRNNGNISNQTILETSASPLFSTTFTPASTNIWGSDYAFFGSTTPVNVLASVSNGVTDTGVSLWPLLIFLGIGIAFIIGTMVVTFINRSTKTTIKSGKEEFIMHNASDLEFKRNYGRK